MYTTYAIEADDAPNAHRFKRTFADYDKAYAHAQTLRQLVPAEVVIAELNAGRHIIVKSWKRGDS